MNEVSYPSIPIIAGNGILAPVSSGAYQLSVDESDAFSWSGIHTHTNDVIFDGATAGRDITFDRSENRLRLEDNAELTFGAGGSTPYDVKLFSDGTQLIAEYAPVSGNTAVLLITQAPDPFIGESIPMIDGGNDASWTNNGIIIMRFQVFAYDPTGTFDSYLLSQDRSEDGYIYLSFDSAANVGKIEVGGADNSTNVIAMGVDNITTKFGLGTGSPYHTFEIGTDNARAQGTSGWLVGGSLSASDHKGRFRDDNTQVVVESVSSLRPMRVSGGPNTGNNGSGSGVDIRSGASAGNGGSSIIGYAVPSTQGSGTTVRNPVEHFRAAEGCFTVTHPSEANSAGTSVFKAVSVTSGDDPTIDWRQARVTTTNATLTTLFTLAIPTDTAVNVEVKIIGRRTGGSGGTAQDCASYHYESLYKNVSGTATIEGTVTTIAAKESNAAWDAQLNVSSGNLLIQVQGDTNNNITWHLSKLEINQVSS